MKLTRTILILAVIILTASCAAQGNDKICLTVPEMDYFLYQDLSQKALCRDTTEYIKQIKTKNIQIALYKANEADLKSMVTANKTLANNYKTTAVDFQEKYTKSQDKAKFRGKVLIGSLTFNILLVAGIIVFLK